MFSTVHFATIKGLQPSFPELGRIKIGMLGETRTSKSGTKFRLPEKLDHFRVTLRVRDTNGQFALDEEVHKQVGERPTELAITLLYDDPTLNCPSRLNCYVGSKRWCHGNGERALRLDAQGIYREQACPCPLLIAPEQAEQNRDKHPNDHLKCKPNGSLAVQLPYKRTSVGIYRFRTTSVESIQSILTVQGAILMRTGGVLAGVPLRLRLYPATDNTPGGASKSWKVTLDLPPGGWDEVDRAAQEIVKARATTRLNMKAIEAQARRQMKALVEDTSEAAAIIDELFPKPITVIDGIAVLDDEPPDGAIADLTPVGEEVKPEDTLAGSPAAPAALPGPGSQAPDPQAPSAAGSEQPAPDPDEMRFQTALDAEQAAGSAEVKAEAVQAQLDALGRLMARKLYRPERLKRPLSQFSREERAGFARHLLAMPDAAPPPAPKAEPAQAALPWDR